MAVITMLAIAVDWIGKPLRHRRFEPRIYRYADELAVTDIDPTRTAYSDDNFILPRVLPAGAPYIDPAGHSEWAHAHFVLPNPDPTSETWGALAAEDPTSENMAFEALINVDTYNTYERGLLSSDTIPGLAPVPSRESQDPTVQIPVVSMENTEPVDHTTFQALVESAVPHQQPLVHPDEATSEPGVWRPGDPLWTPTKRGSSPSPTTLRRRFWQSASVLIPNVRWYGEENVDRMVQGKAPQRRNRRNGRIETMQLSGLKSAEDAASARPRWPGDEIDPFRGGA